MKKTQAVVLVLIVFCPALALAAIPPAVTITKVNMSGSFAPGDGNWQVEIKDGRVAYQENVYAGQRQAEVASLDYNFDFWNVGEEGGREGMLWWKKDHGLAVLTFTYNFAAPGKIVKKGQKFGELQGYQFEDAKSEPEVAPVAYKFRFSGGPNGTFTELEPYASPAGPAKGRVMNGTGVVFDFPRSDHKSYPYLVETQRLGLPWEIPGNPFFGYETDELGPCGQLLAKKKGRDWRFVNQAFARDSGARFSDFTGEVTVRPAGDPADERPAEMDMVLETGDTIETQGDSCAIISFADMTTFLMKPFSKVILETPPERDNKLRLLAGKIWVNVRKMIKDGTMEVTMNQAVAGTKGTTFVAEEDGAISTIKVIEGLMGLRSTATGEETDISPGEQGSAGADGAIRKAGFDSRAESEDWEAVKAAISRAGAGYGTTGSGSQPTGAKNVPALFIGIVSAVAVALAVFSLYRKKKKI